MSFNASSTFGLCSLIHRSTVSGLVTLIAYQPKFIPSNCRDRVIGEMGEGVSWLADVSASSRKHVKPNKR